MQPTNPWSRHRGHHHNAGPGAEFGTRQHHPHPAGPPWSDQPGGRRHHPRGGPGFPGAGPWGEPGEGPGERPGERHGRRHGGRGPRGRAGRGDVRTALLILLAEEPMHGYQLMQAVAERTGGAWQLSPGAVYPTIAQLEDEGLVQVTAQGGRKLVTLTDAGREHLTGLGSVDPFATFGGEGERPDLRGAVGELMGAVHQLGRVGDPAQLTAAAKVLADARRSLYLILAGAADEATPGDDATS